MPSIPTPRPRWRPADLVAHEILRKSGVDLRAGSEVNIRLVAKRVDCDVVNVVLGAGPEIDFHAELRPSFPRAQILIRADLPEVRQRFAIAHELGHWAVRSPGLSSERVRGISSRYESEETYADLVAGALLLPNRWVEMVLTREPHLAAPTLSNLKAIAARAKVSLEVATIQLRSSLGWNVSVLHWVFDRGRWIFLGEAGLPAGVLKHVRPTDATAAGLTRAAQDGEALPLWIGGVVENYHVDVDLRDQDAVVFVNHDHVRPMVYSRAA